MSNDTTAIYRLDGITKQYGTQLVLDVPALDVEPGEVLAVVGPSGAGKSTLLRLLNMLEPPTSGTIYFQDHAVTCGDDVPMELRRRVTTVFQRPMLLSTSVFNNVAYGLRLRRAAIDRERVRAALSALGLRPLAAKPAQTLSGGEQQRVALARALVIDPQALLLDEPTANLDPYNVQLIEQTIADLHRQRGTTIVLVTHNLFQARRLAQRVALLLSGRIVEVADVTTFFTAPHDSRTSAFVRGEMVY